MGDFLALSPASACFLCFRDVSCRLKTNAFFIIHYSGFTVFPATTSAESPSRGTNAPLNFSQQILPLLARNCFPCHGPDESSRQADLRLDSRQAVIDAGVLDPDDLASSSLLERVQSTDPDLRMPPPDFGKDLAPEERDKITAWVEAGAAYDVHWAFKSPEKPTVPQVEREDWSRTSIDRFLFSSMQQQGLQPAATADRYTLMRRLYQDLLGLIPTPEAADDSLATRVQLLTSTWWISCSLRRVTANTGRVLGSTSPVTPIRMATRKIVPVRFGPIATGS